MLFVFYFIKLFSLKHLELISFLFLQLLLNCFKITLYKLNKIVT